MEVVVGGDEDDEDSSLLLLLLLEGISEVVVGTSDGVVEVVVGTCVVVGAACVEVGVSSLSSESSLPEPSVLKTTMLAVDPLGTVTTQKEAPPAPTSADGLSVSPMALSPIEHGSPLQPPSGHSTLSP